MSETTEDTITGCLGQIFFGCLGQIIFFLLVGAGVAALLTFGFTKISIALGVLLVFGIALAALVSRFDWFKLGEGASALLSGTLLVGGVVLILSVGSALVGYVYYTFPLCLLFAFTLALWLRLRMPAEGGVSANSLSIVDQPLVPLDDELAEKSGLHEATESVVGSITVGVGSVTGLVFILSALRDTIDPAWVWTVEVWMVKFRIWTDAITGLKFLKLFAEEHVYLNNVSSFLIIVGILFLITYFIPKLKLVTRFFDTKKKLSSAILTLNVITSFSFFSSIPINEAYVTLPSRRVERYQELLREEWACVAEHLAAEALNEELKRLDEPGRVYHRAAYTSLIQKNYTADELDFVLDELIGNIARTRGAKASREDFDKPASESEGRLAESASDDTTSKGSATKGDEAAALRQTAQRWALVDEQERILNVQQERAEDAQLIAEESHTVMKKTFSELLGLAVPDALHEVGKTYVKKLISIYSDRIAESIEGSERSNSSAGRRSETAAHIPPFKPPAGEAKFFLLPIDLMTSSSTTEAQAKSTLERRLGSAHDRMINTTEFRRTTRSTGSTRPVSRPRPRGRP